MGFGVSQEQIDVENELADTCGEFYDDPLGWVMWAFDWGHGDLKGRDGPDEWQREYLINLGEQIKTRKFNGIDPVDPIRKAVASGHGVGKSALTAWLILFILSTRAHSKGVVTANTAEQLKTKTWAELAKWKRLCITGHWFELTSGKGSLSIYHPDHAETWRADGLTSREEASEAFAGLHNANSTAFYLFDEASNIPDIIWEVAEGGLTDGEPWFMAFGNPTRNSGKFKKCFHPSSRWAFMHVDARKCKMPNHKLHKQWIEDHGIDSDFVRVRVLGMFPKADDTQFISSGLVGDAMNRGSGRYLGTDPLICGVDVARGGGDYCYIQFRRGFDAVTEKTYRIPAESSRDSMRVVSILTDIFRRHQPDQIFVDETGIGGPILDRLVQLGFPALGVKFGGDADNKRMYANKTAEMGDRVRQWLQSGGCLKKDPTLEMELTTRWFAHDSKDRLVLASKDWIKENLGYSPDWADALYLTFAYHVPMLQVPRGSRDALLEVREQLHNPRRGDYDPIATANLD